MVYRPPYSLYTHHPSIMLIRTLHYISLIQLPQPLSIYIYIYPYISISLYLYISISLLFLLSAGAVDYNVKVPSEIAKMGSIMSLGGYNPVTNNPGLREVRTYVSVSTGIYRYWYLSISIGIYLWVSVSVSVSIYGYQYRY